MQGECDIGCLESRGPAAVRLATLDTPYGPRKRGLAGGATQVMIDLETEARIADS